MPYNVNKYIPGDRKVNCDICGFTWRFSDIRKGRCEDQKGYNVCPDCYDKPHPNDMKPKIRKPAPLPEVK